MIFDDLCPKALIQKPFIVKDAFVAVENKHFNRPLAKTGSKIWDVIQPGENGTRYRKNYYMNSMKINPEKPANTITKICAGTGGMMHFSEKRSLTIEELKRLGFFHDKYKIKGTFGEQWMRIGNSVPPGLMRAVAINVRHHLFNGSPLTPYPKSMSYLDILEATWQNHLKPKDENAPTVISTFAGGGGSSLGYSKAGFRELLAVEIDDNAVETFKLNFPHVPVFHGDIGKLSVEECMKLAGLSVPGEIDVFDGSPPCQGFSTAGKRQMADNRNQLFREYVRLLRGLKPKAFIMENVSYFYVPQSRERMIFIGVRKDFWNKVNAKHTTDGDLG